MNRLLPMPVDPFFLDPPPSLLGRATATVARPLLARLLGLDALRRIYFAAQGGDDDRFAERVLDLLSVRIEAGPGGLDAVPPTGPVIIAATHPRGALDGLAVSTLVRTVRPDVRLLANHVLSRIPELRSSCFFVDPFEGPSAEARSLAGLRAAHLWLRRGGALIMFPAGEVSPRRDGLGRPTERRWSETLGRLALSTGATIVPASLDGANSPLFYAAGHLHPRLRTALLPRELLGARHSRVAVQFHRPGTLEGTAADVTQRAQQATRPTAGVAEHCATELARLAPDATLFRAGQFRVFCASAADIPVTLHELGRLRAVSYRLAGEGSATDVDLDPFDRDYLHLFAWDDKARCIVGAYRLGRTDVLVNSAGVDRLYTRTLFRYGPELIQALSPALELGRSFVRPEYQRTHQALLLLWRGIGTFLVRHPQYRVLFGPVSISARYCDASLSLLTAFLEQNHMDASLARLLTPMHPRPAVTAAIDCAVPVTAANADRLVAQLEDDGKGMPVLLRQYLKLNARALGFSVDPNFGHVVDALMAIDLTTVSPAILRRYLGDEGFTHYSRHHHQRDGETAAA